MYHASVGIGRRFWAWAMQTDDDENIWLAEARGLLVAAHADRRRVETSLRQMCRRAFADFQFPPSMVVDHLAVSTPGLFNEAGFTDDEVDVLMPTVDRIVAEEWANPPAG